MKITRCVELTNEECKAIEATVRIVGKLTDELAPLESYDTMFCYLVDSMEDGSLPNLIKFY